MSRRLVPHRGRSGFTLLELLVVVAIIGILAVIAFPAYAKYREQSLDAAALSDLRQALHHIEIYVEENDAFPTDVSEIEALGFNQTPSVVFTRFDGAAEGVHLHVEHTQSSHYYHYRYPQDGLATQRDK